MSLRHRSDDGYTSAPSAHHGPPRADGPARERGVAPAILWSVADDPYAPPGPASVRCVLCAHRCLLRPGRRGICGVRENREGELVTLVYGELVAAHLDPIEKKPLFHILPGSTSYSIATVGCPFRCGFCQNWEIAQAPREGIGHTTFHAEPEEVVASALAAGARSIAYTYVEPTIFAEYLLDVAGLAHRAGLRNVLVTNGYLTPEAIEAFAPWIDAANVDLKGFDDAVYRKVCGARLAPVLETLAGFRAAGVWLEVTTLLIPGFTDDPVGLRELTGWIARELGPETPWHVSRFFPAYRFGHVHPTPVETIRSAAAIGREAGLVHVYAGNLGQQAERDDAVTRCARCGTQLVARSGYRVAEVRLHDGTCPICDHRLPGIFDGAPEWRDLERPSPEGGPEAGPDATGAGAGMGAGGST
jgi:pyruvate formate lyase activating enzyme